MSKKVLLFLHYINNVFAYVNDQKVMNEYTGELIPPNEELMQSVEKCIPFSNIDSWRSYVVNTTSSLFPWDWESEKLYWNKIPLTIREAIEAKLYEDSKELPKQFPKIQSQQIINPIQKEFFELDRLIEL